MHMILVSSARKIFKKMVSDKYNRLNKLCKKSDKKTDSRIEE